MSNRSVWSTDRALWGATIQGQIGHGSDGSEGVVCIPQSHSIKVASPSDFKCHIKDTRLGGVLQRRGQFVLRSQPTGLIKIENERNQRRNRTLKTREYQNSEKEGIWYIGNGYQKTSRHEKNMRIEYLRRIEKKILKPNSSAEIWSNEKQLYSSFCQILMTILDIDEGGTQKIRPKNKIIEDDAQRLPCEGWHLHNIWVKENK